MRGVFGRVTSWFSLWLIFTFIFALVRLALQDKSTRDKLKSKFGEAPVRHLRDHANSVIGTMIDLAAVWRVTCP